MQSRLLSGSSQDVVALGLGCIAAYVERLSILIFGCHVYLNLKPASLLEVPVCKTKELSSPPHKCSTTKEIEQIIKSLKKTHMGTTIFLQSSPLNYICNKILFYSVFATLNKWFRANQLFLNFNKTNYLHFTTKRNVSVNFKIGFDNNLSPIAPTQYSWG
jgi:hypothetical protein